MRYAFDAEVWLYTGAKSAWHFVSLPPEFSEGIRGLRGPRAAGWGSVRVTATIGETTWRTSIFPAESGVFVLPLKAEVRAREHIGAGDRVAVAVEIEL
ncbi:DUF1905 domain-containing protein [Phenylobacterium sp.]|uniref:DUF1905 domain-containing protein n=1 Tax=Phenylobacterium sp. TaxID=1871053 RepID=UPI002EDAA0D0